MWYRYVHPEVVGVLLDTFQELDVNVASSRTRWTALQRACGVSDGRSARPLVWQFSHDQDRVTIVRRLLSAKANVNAAHPKGRQPFDQTPTWIAARMGFSGVLRVLIEAKGAVSWVLVAENDWAVTHSSRGHACMNW